MRHGAASAINNKVRIVLMRLEAHQHPLTQNRLMGPVAYGQWAPIDPCYGALVGPVLGPFEGIEASGPLWEGPSPFWPRSLLRGVMPVFSVVRYGAWAWV